jgi:hypothetical protein
MRAMLPARADRGAPLCWVEIGSMAGLEAAIPSDALRSARLQLVGSGIGAVSAQDFAAELPAIARVVTEGAVDVRTRVVPLARVESAWAEPAGSARLVLVP